MTVRVRRGWKPLAAATATAMVALTGAVLGGTPTGSAAPALACDTPTSIADLAAHDPVHGLTVSSGVTPDPFTGEVLGVLKDGIAPGVDMVMVRLTSTEIDRVGGIWAGMSGSPVYAEDGTLIGAVAYGLAYGPSPVAGVTPYELMDDYLTPAPRVAVGERQAQRIAAATGVTAAQAEQGFRQLPMAGGVGGLSQSQLDKLTSIHNRRYLAKTAKAAPVGTSKAATSADIVAGGNLVYAASYGDVNIAAVGTVTSVCGTEVVGFGHPATYTGHVTAALTPADAVYIQEDPAWTPFKVANIAPPVGTISEDHRTGVTGEVGPVPDAFSVEATATYGARTRTGSTDVFMQDYAPNATLYQIYYNQDRVVDQYLPGSEDASWTITGTKPDSTPFSLQIGDRYRSTYDITDYAVWDPADLVYLLSQIEGVSIDSVVWNGTVSDSVTEWKVKGMEAKVGGAWVKIPANGKVTAKAGTTLKLRALLTSTMGDTTTAPIDVPVPAKLAGGSGRLRVIGGGDTYMSFWGDDTIDEILATADGYVRNDQVVVELDAGAKGGEVHKEFSSAAQDMVVEGHKNFRIVVK
ncbi:MAG: hypothetical protein U0R80_18095 [Nocardioidaceae bacterium]